MTLVSVSPLTRMRGRAPIRGPPRGYATGTGTWYN